MDLNFHTSYGDLALYQNDLKATYGEEMLIQRLVQTLKTNAQDYPLNPTYGVDIESYIGRPVSEALAEEIGKNIESALRLEGLPSGVRALHLIRNNEIHYRIQIPGLKSQHFIFVEGKGFKPEITR